MLCNILLAVFAQLAASAPSGPPGGGGKPGPALTAKPTAKPTKQDTYWAPSAQPSNKPSPKPSNKPSPDTFWAPSAKPTACDAEPETGACCIEHFCFDIGSSECEKNGGNFMAYTECEDSPCPGACCKGDGDCAYVTEKVCKRKWDGDFLAGSTCSDEPCEPTGSCCKTDGSCVDEVTKSTCGAGVFIEGGACTGGTCMVDADCCDEGKNGLVDITMIYTAGACSATTNDQDGKVECDDYAGALPDDVCIYASSDDDDSKSEFFSGQVSKGGMFTLARADTFESKSYIFIKDASCGTTLQRINFHTSCSQTLETGMTFASSFLYACTTQPKD